MKRSVYRKCTSWLCGIEVKQGHIHQKKATRTARISVRRMIHFPFITKNLSLFLCPEVGTAGEHPSTILCFVNTLYYWQERCIVLPYSPPGRFLIEEAL